MTTSIRILGIAGSLRRGSYNRAALRAATDLAPKGAIVETFELDGIPTVNQDEEENPPARNTISSVRRGNVGIRKPRSSTGSSTRASWAETFPGRQLLNAPDLHLRWENRVLENTIPCFVAGAFSCC